MSSMVPHGSAQALEASTVATKNGGAAERGASVPASHIAEITLRLALGLILVVAGLVKFYDQGGTSGASAVPEIARRAVIAQFEILLGGWLLVIGFRPRFVFALTSLCFAVFACAAAYHYGAGEASCGCFGHVKVKPKWMLLADILAVLALLAHAARRGTRAGKTAAIASFICVWIVALLGSGFVGASRNAADMNAGDTLEPAPRVVLRPETWIGKRFWLADYIQGGGGLLKGRWLVLLHRRDCPRCAAVKKRLDEVGAQRGRRRFAFIEIPANAHGSARMTSPGNDILHLSLNPSRRWYGETPAIILLSAGVVEAAFDDERSDPPRRAAQDGATGAGWFE